LRLNADIAQKLWKASLCKAVAARELARGLDPIIAEEAYLAGLFQDIALPVMLASAQEAMTAMSEQRMRTQWRLEAERAALGANHAEFGAMLALQMKLPAAQASLIPVHHDLQGLLGVAAPPLAHAAYAASLFPHRLDYWDQADVEALREFLGSDAGGNRDFEEFLNQVSAECKKEFSYFDRSRVTEIKLVELISQATREAAEETVRLMAAVQDMKQTVAVADEAVQRLSVEQRQLAAEAARDPLTGALNRAGFQKECERALATTRRLQLPVGMIFIDADRFKELNDRNGHAAGDEALRQIVAAAVECTRTTDLIGRIGGDEFAVLLANCPEERATEIAKRLRENVGARQVGGGWQLSVSVGVVWTPGTHVPALDALMVASDQRMYRAKRAGGNTVAAA
jgi:diguanylate cyclase (GGDEF)-like protein